MYFPSLCSCPYSTFMFSQWSLCIRPLLWLSHLNLERNTKYGIQKNFIKFLNFLFEYEYVPKIFRLNKDVRVKALVKGPIIFSDKDRKKIIPELIKQEKNDNFRLMIYLLMYSGLRPSDIINLTVEQIDLEKMEMRFYSSKTGNWFCQAYPWENQSNPGGENSW